MFILTTLALAPCLPAVAAQDVPPTTLQGMFNTFPVAVSFNGQAAPYELKIKRSGVQGGPSQANPPSSVPGSANSTPDWSKATQLDLGGQIVHFAVDAISTGNGTFPNPNGNGWMALPTGNGGGNPSSTWAAITVSVSNTTTGRANSHFNRTASANIPVGSELVSYYFPGSTALAPGFSGRTIVEMTRRDIGLGAAGNQQDISSMDYALPSLQESGPLGATFSEDGKFYFSLTPEWIAARRAAVGPGNDFFWTELAPNNPHTSWWFAAPDQLPHPGDIYVREWVEVDQRWSTPERVESHEDLNLKPADLANHFEGGNVDALEYNEASMGFIFSATGNAFTSQQPTSEISQLMYFDGSRAHPLAARNATGQKIASKLGVRDGVEGDEIDGACAVDPESPVSQTYHYFGKPFTSHSRFTESMGLSIYRGWPNEGDPNDALSVAVSGFGDIDPQDGTLTIFISATEPVGFETANLDAGWLTPANGWTRILTHKRKAEENIVQNQWTSMPAITDREMWFLAVQRDRFGATIAVSVLSRIYI